MYNDFLQGKNVILKNSGFEVDLAPVVRCLGKEVFIDE